MKLIFRRDTKEILGVHMIGIAASELIHFGMLLVQLGRHPRRHLEFRIQLSDDIRGLPDCRARRNESSLSPQGMADFTATHDADSGDDEWNALPRGSFANGRSRHSCR